MVLFSTIFQREEMNPSYVTILSTVLFGHFLYKCQQKFFLRFI